LARPAPASDGAGDDIVSVGMRGILDWKFDMRV
jgi:hypothetical protein